MSLWHWTAWLEAGKSSPRFLVDDFIHAHKTMITGKPGMGKTNLTSALVHAVASGSPDFCGSKVNLHGPVVVFCTDGGEPHKWGLRMAELETTGSADVYIAAYDPQKWERHAEEALGRRPALLVFDNLFGAVRGSINDDEQANRVLRQLDRFEREGVAVLALHHSGRNHESKTGRYTPTHPMGSTVLDAWHRHHVHVEDLTTADSVRLVQKGNDYPGKQTMTLGVSYGMHAASYSLVKVEDGYEKRPRQAEAHAKRMDLYDLVVSDGELVKIESQAELGRRLLARFPEKFPSQDAARVAFARAMRSAGGSYVGGRYTPRHVVDDLNN